ncbi:MAG: hypothetical protein R2834_07855 [Rhodothermales bacterium]
MSIQDAKRKHQDALMAIPGVVTLGIGLTTDHVPAIMVGVTDLSAPAVKQVPKKLEGHPVFIFEAGRVQAQ